MGEGVIHKGDVGTAFKLYIEDEGKIVDISEATVKEIIFKKPSGASVTKEDVPFVTDGKDGGIEYVTVADDLDEVGNWKIQGEVELSDGRWHTTVHSFTVFKNID